MVSSPANKFTDVSWSSGNPRSQRLNWWTISPAAILAASAINQIKSSPPGGDRCRLGFWELTITTFSSGQQPRVRSPPQTTPWSKSKSD